MRTRVIWAVSALTATLAAAGPVRMNDIPAEARWWAHLDVEQFKQTEVGRTFLELMNQPEIARKLDALKAIFNFDIRTDLDGLTACGAGRRSAVIARGRFDQQRLLTLLRGGDGYEELVLDGRTIHSWIDEGKAKKQGADKARMYGAIHRSGAAVLSEQADTVAHVLKVLDGEAESLPAAALTPEYPAVLTARMSAEALPQKATDHPVARQLLSAAGIIGQHGTNVEARLEMTLKDAEAVAQIRQVVEGVRAAALLNAERDPRAARLAELVDLRTEGNTLALRLSIPAAEITDAIRSDIEKKRASPAQP